jgi:hypothetical protein
MENTRKYTIYTFVGYIILLTLDGVIRVNMILNLLPVDDKLIPVFVSTFTLLISTAFIALTIIIIGLCTSLYLYIVGSNVETNDLMRAWKNLLLVDICFEVIKIELLWVLFNPELKNLKLNSDNLIRDLGTLSSLKINHVIDQITIYLSIGVFTLTLYQQCKQQKFIVISLGAFLLGLNMLLYYKII